MTTKKKGRAPAKDATQTTPALYRVPVLSCPPVGLILPCWRATLAVDNPVFRTGHAHRYPTPARTQRRKLERKLTKQIKKGGAK